MLFVGKQPEGQGYVIEEIRIQKQSYYEGIPLVLVSVGGRIPLCRYGATQCKNRV